MPNLVRASVITDIQAFLQGASEFNSAPIFDGTIPRAPVPFAAGSGNQQANLFYASAARALAGGANEAFVLSDGSMVDPLNGACAFAVIHALEIRASPLNTGSLKFGAATNQFSGPVNGTNSFMTLNPGDGFLWLNTLAGWAVTGSSNDGLKMLNNNGSVTNHYDIKILGT